MMRISPPANMSIPCSCHSAALRIESDFIKLHFSSHSSHSKTYSDEVSCEGNRNNRYSTSLIRQYHTHQPGVPQHSAFLINANSLTRQATSSSKVSDPNDLLRKQRLNRPTSPNLSIYRPQITSVLSLLHRNTGLVVSGGFYLFFAAYVVSPWLGWHIDSASMAASYGALPIAAKVFLKTTVALPFTFHCLNGVRHLVWDSGRALSNKQVIKSGWAVVGLSISSALLLGFM